MSMRPPDGITRRHFLRQTACAALGTTGLLSTLLNLGLASRVGARETGDYRAIICLFLMGGNDSYNTLIPLGRDEYKCYTTIRGGLRDPEAEGGGLALPLEKLVPIQPRNIPGRPFGLHPGLAPFQRLFDDGHLSFVANIGSLREPFKNVRQYQAQRGDWPLGLFSHSDQQQQWQTCVPDARSGIGWAGRAMDVLAREHESARRSTFNISFSGMNILQTGREIVPYTMNPDGLVGLAGFDRAVHGGAGATLSEQVIAARTGLSTA